MVKQEQCKECGSRTKKGTTLYPIGDELFCNRHLQPYIDDVWCSNCGDTGHIRVHHLRVNSLMICPRCKSYIVIGDDNFNYHSIIEEHELWLKEHHCWYSQQMDEVIYIKLTKGVVK